MPAHATPQVRLHNPAFHTRVGRLAGARPLLQVAGFVEQTGQGSSSTWAGEGGRTLSHGSTGSAPAPGGSCGEGRLVLVRHDPGLLWLVLGSVREARSQVAMQGQGGVQGSQLC